MNRIGGTTVEKVHEMDPNGMTLKQLMPGVTDPDLRANSEWLLDGQLDFLKRAAEAVAIVFTSHFPLSSAGHVNGISSGSDWHFIRSRVD